jgi:hypothetical protein
MASLARGALLISNAGTYHLLISKLGSPATVYTSECLREKSLQGKSAFAKPKRNIHRLISKHYTPHCPTGQAQHDLDIRYEGRLFLCAFGAER